MKKNKIMLLTLALVLLIVVSTAVTTNANLGEMYSNMYSMGRFDKSKEKNGQLSILSNGTVAYKGKNVTITAEEVERVIGRTRAVGNTEMSDSHIIAVIAKNESLYYKAVEAGISVTDKEVSASVDMNREVIERADNYADFQAYLDGLGKTADEYWEDWKKDRICKRDMIIEKYLSILQKEMLANGRLSSMDLDEWYVKLDEISIQAVKDEEIRSVKNGKIIEIEIDGLSLSVKDESAIH